MGVNFFFDKMLPAQGPETKPGDRRQLEVFTCAGKNYVRIGPINKENGGPDRYTVEVPPEALLTLREALQFLPAWGSEITNGSS